MSTPARPADPERDHACQTGCGRRAEVVITRLSDSETDILCDTCNLAFWAAVMTKVAEDAGVPAGA